MALGQRKGERQGALWISTSESARGPRHVFYERLNAILSAGDFDEWVEELCAPYYADEVRPSIPPGVFFRMMYVGYFEGIDSQRGHRLAVRIELPGGAVVHLPAEAEERLLQSCIRAAAETLEHCDELGCFGVKTYIPEPERKVEWSWIDKPESQQRAVTNNRHRTRRAYGKRLQRRRSELVERSFAHVCETGSGRRSWLRGIEEVRKRHLMTVMAHNLGLILRKLLGAGKVRAFAALFARIFSPLSAVFRLLWPLQTLSDQFAAPFRRNPVNHALIA